MGIWARTLATRPSIRLCPPRHRLYFIDHQNPGRRAVRDRILKTRSPEKRDFDCLGGYTKSTAARWDNRYLVAGHVTGEAVILDFERVIPQQRPVVYTSCDRDYFYLHEARQ